jgi:ABC-type uncharacterized transport system substrate-binding protein
LTPIDLDLTGIRDPKKLKQISERISTEADLFFATGKVLPTLIKLPPLKTPVCFLSTKETAAIIPADRMDNFTGVIRASYSSIIEKSQRMMQGAKKMGMLAHTHTNVNRLIGRYRKIAAQFGITIELRFVAAKEEIGPTMQEMKLTNDFVVLFSSPFTPEDLAEIVYWQNRLQLPVLSQFKSHIRAGLLGGLVVDEEKVAPKLAEYMDKLLQGRNPATLPIYFYPERYVINLRTVSILQLDIPAEITVQAEIIR